MPTRAFLKTIRDCNLFFHYFREEGEKEDEEKNDDIYEDEEYPLTEEEEEEEEEEDQTEADKDVQNTAEELQPSLFSNIITWFLSLFGFCNKK